MDHGHEDPLAALVGITSHDSPPEDEVLRRLLPNAYADEVDASEFRRYTEWSDLTSKEKNYGRRIGLMSLFNYVNPNLWRIGNYKLSENIDCGP